MTEWLEQSYNLYNRDNDNFVLKFSIYLFRADPYMLIFVIHKDALFHF